MIFMHQFFSNSSNKFHFKLASTYIREKMFYIKPSHKDFMEHDKAKKVEFKLIFVIEGCHAAR